MFVEVEVGRECARRGRMKAVRVVESIPAFRVCFIVASIRVVTEGWTERWTGR